MVGKSWTEKTRRESAGGCTDPAFTEQIGFQGQLEEWTEVKVLTGQAVSDH